MDFTIVKGQSNHLHEIAILFDAYRVFYKQPSDLTESQKFLEQRFKNSDSVIFLAFSDDTPIGFTQLYKTFSSVTIEPFYILNDLFVQPSFRGQGVGASLLKKTKEFCQQIGYKGLTLETANNNPAQKLYEKLGWKKDTDFLHYFWKAPDK